MKVTFNWKHGGEAQSLAIYPTTTSEPRERALSLCRAFKIDGLHEQVTRSSRIYSNKQGWLEVYDNSPSFRWRGAPEGWRPQAVDCAVSGERAKAIAKEFLTARGLWREPNGVEAHDTTVVVDRENPPFTPERVIAYTFRVGDQELYGPGARTVVTVGPDGQVSEMHRFDRAPSPSPPMLRPTSRPQAEEQFVDWFEKHEDKDKPNEVAARLAYLAAPPRQTQSFLVPFYIYRWRSAPVGPDLQPAVHFQAAPAVSVEGISIAPFTLAPDSSNFLIS